MAAPLTEAAIARMRKMIARGDLEPGARLPPEGDLADLLGASPATCPLPASRARGRR